MTFIKRQVELLAAEANVKVVCRSSGVAHLSRYPHIRVPRSFFNRLIQKALRIFRLAFMIPCKRLDAAIEDLHQKYRVDLAIAHFGPAGIELNFVTQRLGIPTICIFHGFDSSSLLRNASYTRQLQNLKGCVLFFASASLELNMAKRISLANLRCKVVHLGLDLTFVQKVGTGATNTRIVNEEFILCQAANFVEKKGQKVLIDAFARVAHRFPAMRLRLIGDGPLRSTAESLAAMYGLRDRIEFTGYLNDSMVLERIAQSDLFLHPSMRDSSGNEESIPTVIMEAMALGIPVISTNHGGIPELVLHQDCGLLVQENDSVELSVAIESLFLDAERRTVFAERAKKHIQNNFNMNRQVLQIFETIEHFK